MVHETLVILDGTGCWKMRFFKCGSWRTHKFKISGRKYRWKIEQIIRLSFHRYLFTPLKKGMLCPNSAHHRWQTHNTPSVTVQISASEAWRIRHSSIPHCPGITCFLRQLRWKDCSGRLQTNSYLQSPKDNFSSNKKCLFVNYSKLTMGFL